MEVKQPRGELGKTLFTREVVLVKLVTVSGPFLKGMIVREILRGSRVFCCGDRSVRR